MAAQKPNLPPKLAAQIAKAGLPQSGQEPYRPQLVPNRRGQVVVAKAAVQHGPKAGKRGWVDDQGRIWIRDYAHAGLPDHWDVQDANGTSYFRVDMGGMII